MVIDKPKLSDISDLRILWQEAFGDGDEYLDLFFRRLLIRNAHAAFRSTEKSLPHCIGLTAFLKKKRSLTFMR